MTFSARLAGILYVFLPLYAATQETSAPAPTSTPPAQVEPDSPAIVQVTGVETLKDYAAVGRLLASVDGVRRVDVTEANGPLVTFRVLVRGGGATLDRALAGSSQLTQSATSGGRLIYEYKR